MASRHLTVASVLENIGTVGVVNAGSTLQMLQVVVIRRLTELVTKSLIIVLIHVVQWKGGNVKQILWCNVHACMRLHALYCPEVVFTNLKDIQNITC